MFTSLSFVGRAVLGAALVSAALGPAQAQWEMETSNTTADLRGIHSVGNGVAWASGTNGTVLRTEDGGYVWQTCAMPPGAEKLDFRGIQGFDANTAIVMSSGKGDLSRLYKTTDGCSSWKLVFTNPDKDGFWDAIQFHDHNQGFVLGDPVAGLFVLFFTLDGGYTWGRVKTDDLKSPNAKSAAFAASNSAMTLESRGMPMFGTSGPGSAWLFVPDFQCTNIIRAEHPAACFDGSLRFARLKLPIAGDSPTEGMFSVADNSPEDKLVEVGGDYERPDVSSGTAAIGFPWKYPAEIVPAQTPPHGYRSSVAYDSATKTWITVGPNGTDISTDDGKNWRPLHPDPARHEAPDADRNWNAISLPFVVGPHGRIGKLNAESVKR
jgi:photosystem II stability/assembly factor-like uncharacterized protein